MPKVYFFWYLKFDFFHSNILKDVDATNKVHMDGHISFLPKQLIIPTKTQSVTIIINKKMFWNPKIGPLFVKNKTYEFVFFTLMA